jgi:Rhodopirellula transposase DDE domain
MNMHGLSSASEITYSRGGANKSESSHQPLTSHEVIVALIGRTTNESGLEVRARLDRRRYSPGRTVPDDEREAIRLTPDSFHGDWNVSIQPREVEH